MKKLSALFAALCVLAFFAVGCAQADRQALLSDYDDALLFLEEYCCVFPIVRQENPAFDALCAQGREHVRTRCETAEELYSVLADLFVRIGNPGHLSMLSPEMYDSYAQLVEQGAFSEETPEYRLITDEKTRAVYSAMPRAQTRKTDNSAFRQPYVSYDADRRLLYIRLPSFDGGLIGRDRNVVVDAVRAHPETEHIAFDICGNPGGSDAYWMELLVAPFGETVSYDVQVYFRDNALTREYGLMQGAAPVQPESGGALPGFVEALGLTHTKTWTNTITPPEEERIIHSDAKRWVLTDEYTFSAADGFAGFCKQTRWATLVGRRTRGDGGAVRPFLVRLPETGLLMRFTAAGSANADGTLNTLYGTSPDFPAKPSGGAYDALLGLIDSGRR